MAWPLSSELRSAILVAFVLPFNDFIVYPTLHDAEREILVRPSTFAGHGYRFSQTRVEPGFLPFRFSGFCRARVRRPSAMDQPLGIGR
jgi:hypothetical protein